MPELPAGTDRNRLVVVVPREVPDGVERIEHIVGAAWLQSPQGAEDFDFVRFDGETEEQAAAREEAAAAAAKTLETKTEAPTRRTPAFE